jgi:hypothetical protein
MGNVPRDRIGRKTLPYNREVLAQLGQPEHEAPEHGERRAAAEPPPRPRMSRAMTVEDPLTTQVLAAIARRSEAEPVAAIPPPPELARGTIDPTNAKRLTQAARPTHARAVRRSR